MLQLDSRDKILGWGLVIVSVVATVLGVLWFVSADAPIPFSFAAFTGLLFFIGILLIGSDWLEHHLGIMDEIEAFPHAVSYHWGQLRDGYPTRASYMWGATLLLVLFTLYLIFKYDKWTHTLFLGLPAVIIGLLVGGVLFWVFIQTSWFQMRSLQTPAWWYWVPLLGVFLSAGLGIYFTEPIEYGGPTQWQMDARGQTYNYARTRSYTTPFFWGSSSESSSSSGFDFDCDDEVCLGLIIIVIVVILVIASATTPHFWVAATIILCTLLLILSIREIYPPGSDAKKGFINEEADTV